MNLEIHHFPLVAGLVSVIQDPADVKQNITYGLFAIMAILVLMETSGFTIGQWGQVLLTGIPMLLGYIFGKKEGEES